MDFTSNKSCDFLTLSFSFVSHLNTQHINKLLTYMIIFVLLILSTWPTEILTIFFLLQMIPSGLPELTSIQDLKYVRDALQPQTTDAEATIFFTRYGMFNFVKKSFVTKRLGM